MNSQSIDVTGGTEETGDLVLAARELTLYLRHRRDLETRQHCWRVAVVLFTTTLVTSAVLTNALVRYFTPPKHKSASEITSVRTCSIAGEK